MNKTRNNKAWFMVLPVLLLVAFSAVIPLMTVVNYSVQDTFGNNQFFWNGVGWFSDVLESDRFWQALGRNLLFSGIILSIEIPLGILIALNMPKKRAWRTGLPRADGAAAAHSVERRRHDLAGFRPRRYRSARPHARCARHQLQLRQQRLRRLADADRHGRLALDEPCRALVLCRPRLDPGGLLPGGQDRRRVALGRVPLHPAAQDEARPVDRLRCCASWTVS